MISLIFDNDARLVDIERGDKNILTDEGLESAVLISLFTRRRELDTDERPDPNGLRGGWWADPYADAEGDLIGSRLWLLSRSSANQDTVNKARAYAEEALQWLVDDGIASLVEVIAERQGTEKLAFQVQITRPEETSPRWAKTWAAHLTEL